MGILLEISHGMVMLVFMWWGIFFMISVLIIISPMNGMPVFTPDFKERDWILGYKQSDGIINI